MAEETLNSAVSIHPTALHAWMSLAEIQERSGQWDSAYSTWVSLSRLTNDPDVEAVAESAVVRVNDERAVAKVVEAENLADIEQYATSLAILLDAAAFQPSTRILDRAKRRYFEILGRWFAAEIASAARRNGWRSFAVANFDGGMGPEGHSIRDRIYASLQESEIGATRIVNLSQHALRRLEAGETGQISERDWEAIRSTNSDAIVFGDLQHEIRSYTFDRALKTIQPLLTVQAFGEVPGYPSEANVWATLPEKRSTSRGLRVEMWTERPSYIVGDEVVIHLRTNSDCYVTLLDLQTSGEIYVLFPNHFRQDNFIPANQVVSIPDETSPFEIVVAGPRGTEGLKAIATTTPIEIGSLYDENAFISARSRNRQERLTTMLRQATAGLHADEWDIAEWTFEVR